jgi:hypothetical protein
MSSPRIGVLSTLIQTDATSKRDAPVRAPRREPWRLIPAVRRIKTKIHLRECPETCPERLIHGAKRSWKMCGAPFRRSIYMVGSEVRS